MGDPQPIEFDNQILDEIKFKLNLSSIQEILSIQLCKRTKYLLLHLSTMDDNIKPQQNLIEIDFGQTINPWIRGVIITSTSTTTTDFISHHGMVFLKIQLLVVLIQYLLFIGLDEKSILYGYQKSIRGGYVNCEFDQNSKRVLLRGSALTVIQGQFLLQQTQLNLLKTNQNFE